jgi:hypothetical protein
MGVDLVVECLAESDRVGGSLVGGKRLIMVVEPEMELIERVEAR